MALVLPRAGLGAAEIDRMLDLYFGLLHEAGVTKPMLQAAAKAYVMAPTKGKPRFFPDPGQLAELCADEAKNRRTSLAALAAALGVLDGGAAAERGSDKPFDRVAQLRELGEKMRVGHHTKQSVSASETPKAPIINTARPNTDAEELKNHISKKIAQT